MKTDRYRVSVRQDLRPAPFPGRRLKAYVRAALSLLSAGGADVRVRVVGDSAIARWNREYLGRVRPTNALSFPEADGVPGGGGRPGPAREGDGGHRRFRAHLPFGDRGMGGGAGVPRFLLRPPRHPPPRGVRPRGRRRPGAPNAQEGTGAVPTGDRRP